MIEYFLLKTGTGILFSVIKETVNIGEFNRYSYLRGSFKKKLSKHMVYKIQSFHYNRFDINFPDPILEIEYFNSDVEFLVSLSKEMGEQIAMVYEYTIEESNA